MTRRKQITIRLEKTKSDVPIIKFLIDDKWFWGLVDTGSETTIFSPDIWNYLGAGDDATETINLVGFSGEKKQRLLRLSSKLSFIDWKDDTYSFMVSGIVSDITVISDHFMKMSEFDHPLSAILGSNFLQMIDAKIDYQNRLMTCYDIPCKQ